VSARPATLGWPRLHLRSTDSTNERARALALAGAPHGTLVTAEAQSAGRGRQGRTWSAPAGSSLLMSLLLRPAPRLTPLIAAVAACEVARAQGARGALIKWPNDIVIARPTGLAKLAGILVEGRPQEGWAVLGIGLNVAVDPGELPVELRHSAASLGLRAADVPRTLELTLVALACWLTAPVAQMLERWSAHDALCGQRVAWGAPGADAIEAEGVAAGVDGEGRLVVELPSGGRTTLSAGEVHLQRA
jgi:BirA family transcriptional regulator, biotin operon repressor / biotin---[acetyl-CoA-carboxylase] ligase